MIAIVPTNLNRTSEMSWLKRGSLAAIVVVLLTPAAGYADVVPIEASRDAMLAQKFTNKSSSAAPVFCVGTTDLGRTGNPGILRALTEFPVSARIPPGSTIDNVTMTLHMSMSIVGSQSVSLHRVTQDWGDGNSMAGGGGGCDPAVMEADATDGDVTWTHAFYSSRPWTSPGGDYNSTASATQSVDMMEGDYSWSSSAMVTEVQEWLDNPGSNFGWIVIGPEAGSISAKRFDSSENGTVGNRPRLTVNFTPPPDTGACCASDFTCTLLDHPGTGCVGEYLGVNTGCDECPQPTGACCLPDVPATPPCPGPDCPPCQAVTENECAGLGGVYKGDLVQCSDVQSLADDFGELACPLFLQPAVDPLPIPKVAQPTHGTPGGTAEYRISEVQILQQLHRDLPPTTVWGYSDGTAASSPGPTIEARVGLPVRITYVNDLRDSSGQFLTTHLLPVDHCLNGAEDDSVRTVVHLHGNHAPAEFDGHPDDTRLPGEEDVYLYPNNQLATTLWFHDHAMGITRLNVYLGLAAFYLIRDAQEEALGLPAGEFEIPLVIQTRTLLNDGSLVYPVAWKDMFFGTQYLVNGKVTPFHQVKRGKYRFRIVNGSGSRTLTLTFDGPAPVMFQIGSDGGLLEAPVGMQSITLGPAERADMIFDFTAGAAGTRFSLVNVAPAPFTGSGSSMPPELVMQFHLLDEAGHTNPLPPTLTSIDRIPEAEAVVHRDFELKTIPDPCTGFRWTINGLNFSDITEYPRLGTTEVWQFINPTGIMHPMHIHLVMFQVLDRQPCTISDGNVVKTGSPVPPPPEEAGWKDTVKAMPGECTRVIARFEDYTGLFPYHCHILEHEDHEMMRQFQAIDCGNGVVEPTEDCDDGNNTPGDGCSADCVVEP